MPHWLFECFLDEYESTNSFKLIMVVWIAGNDFHQKDPWNYFKSIIKFGYLLIFKIKFFARLFLFQSVFILIFFHLTLFFHLHLFCLFLVSTLLQQLMLARSSSLLQELMLHRLSLSLLLLFLKQESNLCHFHLTLQAFTRVISWTNQSRFFFKHHIQ